MVFALSFLIISYLQVLSSKLIKSNHCCFSIYSFHVYVINGPSLHKGIKYYDIALRIYMGAVLKRVLRRDPQLNAPTTSIGLGDWTDLSGLLLPLSEEQRLVDDIKNGALDTVDAVTGRFEEINENYRQYQWEWTHRMIIDYYQLQEVTLDDAARIKQDYITARRAWIAEIRKDAEKEFRMGDVEKEVLDNFINDLYHEVDFEN